MEANPSNIRNPVVAILIPCHNEAACIGAVVANFRKCLPNADIYVYDNASTDETVKVAAQSGAQVRAERQKGKGNVVRRMFADIEADVYVLVDGDDTYDAASAPPMIALLMSESLDMVNAARSPHSSKAFRPGHQFGNRLLSKMVRVVFGDQLRDMLSGYRVMSRRFVKSFPALSSGFEIETELTVHALELRLPIAEVQTPYRERNAASSSKLSTARDGFRILKTIVGLVRAERPFAFFGSVAAVLTTAAMVVGWPVVRHYVETGLVPRLPTAMLATGLVIMGFLSFLAGLILDTVTHGRKELKRLLYLK